MSTIKQRIKAALRKSTSTFKAEAKLYGLTPEETKRHAKRIKNLGFIVPDDPEAPCAVWNFDGSIILDPWKEEYAAFVKNGIDVGFAYAKKRGFQVHKGDREECTNEVWSAIWQWATQRELFTPPAPPRRPNGTSITKGVTLADVKPCACTGGKCLCPEDQPSSRQKWFFKIAMSRATSFIRPIEQRDQQASQEKHKDVTVRKAQGLPPKEPETFPQHIRLGYKAKRTLDAVLALNAQVDDVVDPVEPDGRLTMYGKSKRRKKLLTALSSRAVTVYVSPVQLDPNVLARKWPAATSEATRVRVKGRDRTTLPPATFGNMFYIIGPIPKPQACAGDGWGLHTASESRTPNGFTPTCYGCHPACNCHKKHKAPPEEPEEMVEPEVQPEDIAEAPDFSWECPQDAPNQFGSAGTKEDTVEDDDPSLSGFQVFSNFDSYAETLTTA